MSHGVIGLLIMFAQFGCGILFGVSMYSHYQDKQRRKLFTKQIGFKFSKEQ